MQDSKKSVKQKLKDTGESPEDIMKAAKQLAKEREDEIKKEENKAFILDVQNDEIEFIGSGKVLKFSVNPIGDSKFEYYLKGLEGEGDIVI